MRSELDRLAHWGGLVAELATAVVVTDVAGRIVIWNPAAARLYGWKADDVLGRRVTPLLLSPDLEGEVATALTSIAAGRRWAGELECKRRDGTRAPVHVTLSAAYDDDGRVIGFVGESRDLSDLKAAEGHASATEQRFHSLLMHTTEVACVTDEHAVFKYVVPSSQSALGYATHELVGTSGLDLVHPDDVELVRGAFADVVADASLHPVVVYRARARDGAEHWREMRLTNALHDPTIVGIVCNVTDMTEQQQLIGELRSADARQRAIVARSRDATLFFERDGTIRWASPVSTDLLGVAPDELIGRNGFEFIHPKDQERALAQFVSMSALGDHVRIEFRIVNAHGDVRWLEEDATNLVDDPDVGYVVGNLRDITDRKRAEEQLERHALYDMLTGLPNRSLLVNRLEQLLERGNAAAILSIDLDRFGDINESLGHGVGDEVLQLVGSRFATALARTPSTLARVGGDEFVALFDGVRDATTALAFAERLREGLRLPVEIAGQEVFVTASIGVALAPGDANGLMRDAGIAMHHAKQEGRDRVTIFDAGLDVTEQRRLAVHNDLRRGLPRGEIVVWYQPMIDLHTNRVAGVEALARWNHPTRGLLGPEQFIDVAESSGLIRALGNHVLRTACADIQRWQEHGCRLHIAVNAAAAQLSSHEYIGEIEAALRDFEVEPDRLTIEITETAAMQIANSLGTLHQIRHLGLHLALDDFGTGYSSLSFLRELPVDAIKIDRSFVSGLGTNSRDTSIVQGVIGMAAALGHAVVAEGIETAGQADLLRRLGCRYAQGFLWSKPVPATEIQAVTERIERAAGTSS